MPRTKLLSVKAFLLLVAVLALSAAAGCDSDEPLPTATPAPAATAQPIGVTGEMLQLPNIVDTVERVRPAVVSIVAEIVSVDFFGRRQSNFGSGTGVIFDQSGLVLTNNHVIEGGVEIIVTKDDGSQVVAEVVGADRLSDLAVLDLPGDGYPFIPLEENGDLRAGEWVIAIGNALALPGGPTVTVGVVSALGRSIEASQGVTLYDLIQTDTSINPGNSGGPLLDLGGNLVGINTAVLRGSSQAGGTAVEGIGFAINTETALQVAEQLIDLGRVRWAWMGAWMADLVPEVAAQVGLPIREGVIIQTVVADGPSDAGGILAGDIVVSMDGHNVATVSGLVRLLKKEFQPGQTIAVEVFRTADGASDRRTLDIELGERPQQ
ncbi:MAG: PDZ domain-containing protein [SAR202 cluster bacterium]|nr:PDZ domain-containing protein [SAR202 cluster bacterium]